MQPSVRSFCWRAPCAAGHFDAPRDGNSTRAVWQTSLRAQVAARCRQGAYAGRALLNQLDELHASLPVASKTTASHTTCIPTRWKCRQTDAALVARPVADDHDAGEGRSNAVLRSVPICSTASPLTFTARRS